MPAEDSLIWMGSKARIKADHNAMLSLPKSKKAAGNASRIESDPTMTIALKKSFCVAPKTIISIAKRKFAAGGCVGRNFWVQEPATLSMQVLISRPLARD
jgi:hypothetical protein